MMLSRFCAGLTGLVTRRRQGEAASVQGAQAFDRAAFEPLERRTLMAAVGATAETTPVPYGGDAADDPAIWVHPADVSQSTIIGTDKQGGLGVYDLSGRQIAYHGDGDMNNVDLRYNFPLGGQSVALVAASNRSNNTIALYAVDTATRALRDVAARPIAVGVGQAYGLAMYHSPVSGKYYAFVSDRNDGSVEQWELFDDGTGRVDATSVRRFDAGGTVEGMAADDEIGRFYAAEEEGGLWDYGAEPDAGSTRTQIDHVDSPNLSADTEGVGIYDAGDGAGYLVVSSQGSNDFNIYEREGSHRFLGKFNVDSGAVDGVSNCDGLEVMSFGLGSAWPEGLLVVQDGSNGSSNQNFKLVDWGDVARSYETDLAVVTTEDPRGGGSTVMPPAAPGNLTASVVSSRRVDLSWADNSDNENGFRVERSAAGGAWSAVARVGAGVTAYTDSTASPETAYSYRVVAYNAGGSSAPSDVITATTPAAEPVTTADLVAAGSTWRYFDNGSDQGTAWRAPTFNDTAWKSGPAQLGYGDGDEATLVNSGGSTKYITTYFRRSFDIADASAVINLELRLLRDDGAAVYLNGVEVVRSNMPSGTLGYTTRASSGVGDAAAGAWHRFTVDPSLLVTGRNVIAVELHQSSSHSSDISFDLALAATQTGQQTPAAPPAAPSGLSATAASPTQVNLSWTDESDNETGFRVERSTDGSTWSAIGTSNCGVTTYADGSAAASTMYQYRVAAYNGAGDSTYSATASATTLAQDDTTYAGPLVITRGGTYAGNWESLDPNVAAVTIRTTEPVVIENSIVRGRGVLIETAIDDADIAVRNTRGFGLNPDVYGLTPGRFLEADRFDSVVLENNYLEGTGGIKLLEYAGDFTPADSVRIVGNYALNIDGRKSDGAGGFLDFNERTRRSDGFSEDGYKIRQFVQLDKVQGVPGVEIAWNRVVNEPGRSRVEDNINIYKSSGTASSPIRIHDNFINGAYTVRPWQGGTTTDGTWDYDWGYSGGGILLGDGSSGVAYVEAYGNTVVSTTNYGIASAAGHHTRFHDNRVVSSGRLADGRWIAEQNVGLYIWDLYDTGLAFYDNSADNNLSGWVNGSDGSRNDWWIPDATSFENNRHWDGQITIETEAAEWELWQKKAAAAGHRVGPFAG